MTGLLDRILNYLADMPKVVEFGTSGIWTYRKWSNGSCECWGTSKKTITGVSKSAIPWAGYDYEFGVIPFPSGLFAAAPTCIVNGKVASNYLVVSYSSSYQSGVSVDLTSNASGSRACEAYIYALGRWR